MEANNIIEVERFIVECNDMLSGKFLDLTKRLDKFLTVLTKSDDLMDFLGECLVDFDDEIEFDKAFSVDKRTGSARVTIPSDDKKRLALYTTIFNNLTNEKINTNQFLETFFQDKKLTPIQNFLEMIVKQYKDLICKYFEINSDISREDVKKHIEATKMQQEEEAKEVEKEQFPHLDDVLQEVTKTCNQILALLKFEKKRTEMLDDLEFVVNSIMQACDKRDLMVINGLVIGLNYVSKKFKNIRHLVEELNDLIYDYYDYLAGDEEK